MKNGKKRINSVCHFIKRAANFKVFLILALCYFVIYMYSEYLDWIKRLLTFPYILDLINTVVMLIVFLVAILIFIRTLMDKRVHVVRKIVIILILFCVLVFLIYVPAAISRNFISDGVILD